MTTYVYDPSENTVQIGDYVLKGVLQIKVQRGNETFRNVEGVSPVYAARIRNYKRPFRLYVKLLHTSPSNKVLQSLHSYSEEAPNAFFTVSVFNNRTVHINTKAYLLKAPDLNLEEEQDDKEWSFILNAFSISEITDLIV